MSAQKSLGTAQKVLQNSTKLNKNIEINMSTLSSAQKQMCLKLLASSNINFEEDRNENCFQAQLRIDPSKLTEQFVVEKQDREQELKASPIKKRTKENVKQVDRIQTFSKQNIAQSSNKKAFAKNKQTMISKQQQSIQGTVKQFGTQVINHAIYTNSRKLLNKTVKINSFTQLQRLHPYVQLYIYPKKMSFQNLIEFIQEVYELYWVVEVQGIANGRKKMIQKEQIQGKGKKVAGDHNARQYKSRTSVKYNGKVPYKQQNIHQKQSSKSTQVNNKADNLPSNHLNIQKLQQKHSFSQWVYENFILVNKQKMKAQQLLVNLIQSLNHFSFKHLGIQMFVNFISGAYSLDVLNYFLVIRALLEQLSQQKIIDKVSNYGMRTGVVYKLKLNPYLKQIEQERVYDFLQVCFQGSRQQQSIELIFEQMTQRMFFDDKRRKNFIHYFDMVDILLKQFLKVEMMSNATTNLQLSVTQVNEESEDFGELLSYDNVTGITDEHEMELTFQVKQAEAHLKQDLYGSELELNHYLPQNNTESQLEDYHHEIYQPKLQQQKKQDFSELLIRQIYMKYETLCQSFSFSSRSESSENTYENRQSKKIMDTLIQAVIKHNKKAWIDMLKNKGKLNQQKQAYELHFVQKLQKQFQLIKNSNFISNQFIKKLLTASYIREAILNEAGISIKTL